jgi:hypothetical protein
VWESESSTVIGDDMWDLLLANLLSNDLAEFETSFLIIDLVWNESTIGIVKNSEIFISLLNRNNIHGTKWESWVSSNLTIDLDQSLSVNNNLSSFVSGKSVLKLLSKKNGKRNAFSGLVWTSGWLGTVNTLEFTEIPLLWSVYSFHNLSLSFIALNNDIDRLESENLSSSRAEKTQKTSNKFLPFCLST